MSSQLSAFQPDASPGSPLRPFIVKIVIPESKAGIRCNSGSAACSFSFALFFLCPPGSLVGAGIPGLHSRYLHSFCLFLFFLRLSSQHHPSHPNMAPETYTNTQNDQARCHLFFHQPLLLWVTCAPVTLRRDSSHLLTSENSHMTSHGHSLEQPHFQKRSHFAYIYLASSPKAHQIPTSTK